MNNDNIGDQGDGFDDGNPAPVDNGGDGGSGGGDAPVPVKIGETEYTPDQLADMQKKAGEYDNLLPDYTLKSQELAKLKGPNKDNKDGGDKGDEKDPPYYDPNWKPKTMGELADALKIAESRGEERALAHLQKIEDKQTEAKKTVDDFVKDTKTSDKEFDDTDFFDWATRHDLPIKDEQALKSAYSVYKEAREAGALGADRANKNRDDRAKDKVSGGQGGKVDDKFNVPMKNLRNSDSAYDAVRDALDKNK